MTTQPPYGRSQPSYPQQNHYGQQYPQQQQYPPAGYQLPPVPQQRHQHPTNTPIHIPPPPPKNGLGTAGFVLGLIALVFSFIPFVGVIAWPLSIIGLVLAAVGVHRAVERRATNKGLAITGVVLSALALLVCILWAAAFGSAVENSQTSSVTSSSATTAGTTDAAQQPAETQDTGPEFPGKKKGDVALAAGGTATFDGLAVTSTPLRAGDSTFSKTLCTTVSYANNGTDTARFGIFNFNLQDPAGAIVNPTFFGGGDSLDSGELAPGGKVSGDVCFEDKANTKGVYVVLYEPNMFVNERAAFLSQR